ncbi:MAG: Crp/Fnr family transcriptional regulator [Intestinimonas sp.]|jgi:CRP/FNR family transcriptional regulator|nr:Crp/Fnr family transcriptional regulator [Intestinimonas sp.]
MEELQEYFPFWNNLTAEQQNKLRGTAQKRHFAKGTMIHSGSDDCIGLLLVIRGQIRVYSLSNEGKELTLYRLFERDMCLFSASCILPSIQFDVMVSAEQDTTVFLVPAHLYKQLMEGSAAVANYTNELMATHFSDVMWLMDQILNKKLDSRLAAFLLEESELTSEPSLALTHEQIASHLGSIREVVTRMLKYFENEGLVKLGRKKITLINTEKLAALAQASRR